MEMLPEDIRSRLNVDTAGASDDVKNNIAMLENMLADYNTILAAIDEKDKILKERGLPEAASKSKGGRSIKKPNKEFDNGMSLPSREGSGSKKKRKKAPDDDETRCGKIRTKFEKRKKDLLERVLGVLHPLRMKYKNEYIWFQSPVDVRHVPNYYNVIKNPMDFDTLKKGIKGGVYANLQDVYRDITLIFDNCRAFNPVGDPVRIAGDVLHDAIKKELYRHDLDGKWNDLEKKLEIELEKALNGDDQTSSEDTQLTKSRSKNKSKDLERTNSHGRAQPRKER